MRPWILFEVGALSKALGRSRMVPYLIDIPLKKGWLNPYEAPRGPATNISDERMVAVFRVESLAP